MYYDQRTEAVRKLLLDYLSSPSLRHIRDIGSIEKLSVQIVRRLDEAGSVWKKWDGRREQILSDALECWIPSQDMLNFLNSLPGPELTATDLAERMRAMIEKESIGDPNDVLREECLEIFEAESLSGTEMPAIIGRISEYVGKQWSRLYEERREAERQRLDAARQEREQRLLSSADCPWTQLQGSRCLYCRKNGRTFRLRQSTDKTWEMHRVNAVDDTEKGRLVGKYSTRGDASKVVAKAAYEVEPRY